MKIALFCAALLHTFSPYPLEDPYSGTAAAATTRIITDYGGFWSSTAGSPNSTPPDNSHMLLGFTYNTVFYSTGVNDGALSANAVDYTPGNWHALPVAGITGTYTSGGNVYLATGRMVDGSPGAASWPGVSDYTIRKVMTDGVHGLDLGTGVTNLPTAAQMTFQIFNIDPAKVSDAEPDILLTQIAQPSTGNDVFSFIDGSGNVVGTSFTQDMNVLPSFGSYTLDLFNLSPNTPYNTAAAYSAYATNGSREIRVVAVRLADFGITAANVAQVRALRIAPSGNSDYAFIAYNANSINLTPNISQDLLRSNTTICPGGTANLTVVGTASMSGTLSYSWEQSTDGGANWTAVVDGGNFAGATTDRLSVTAPLNGYRYRATVYESGNGNPATSTAFTITVDASGTAPSSASVSGGGSFCLNTPMQLTSSVTGGSNLYYQWQSDAGGAFADISGANLSNYLAPTSQTGTVNYRIRVSGGSGCVPVIVSASAAVTVTGIASVADAERCGTGSVTLGATATSGSVSWYAADAGGSALASGNSYNTPSLGSTTTYYVASTGCATALRVPVTAIIHPTTIGGTVSGGTAVVPGNNSTTLEAEGYTGDIVEWQSSVDNFSINTAHIDHTLPQLTVTNLNETTNFRVLVQSGTCPSATSAIATISMNAVMALRQNSLAAQWRGNTIVLSWSADQEQAGEQYAIQRAGNGLTWQTLDTVKANGTSAAHYSWIDQHPRKGDNLYRLIVISSHGAASYSRTVRAVFQSTSGNVSIYPNPVKDAVCFVHLEEPMQGRYMLKLITPQGQVVMNKQFDGNPGRHDYPLALPQSTGRRMYYVQVTDPAGKSWKTTVYSDR